MHVRLVHLHYLVEVLQQLVTEDHRVRGVLYQLDLGCFHHCLGRPLDRDLARLNLDLQRVPTVLVAHVDGLPVVVHGDHQALLATHDLYRRGRRRTGFVLRQLACAPPATRPYRPRDVTGLELDPDPRAGFGHGIRTTAVARV